MRTVEFDLISTLLVSMVVFFLGRFLVAWVPVFRRLNIPVAVVGGGLMALLLALVDGLLRTKISKRSGLRGITIPVHPAVSRYFGTPAPAGPGAPGAQPKSPAAPGTQPKG